MIMASISAHLPTPAQALFQPKEEPMENTKTQPVTNEKPEQPVQVIHADDGWIAAFRKSIQVGSGEFPWEVKKS
jgi:hypothetical protein